MIDGFTRVENALLDSLERERGLLHQRDVVNGIILHEFANAVTVVSGGLELLKHGSADPTVRPFALQQIGHGVAVMKEMIRGLRVLADSTGDSPAYTRGDLADFIRSVVTDPLLVGTDQVSRIQVLLRGSHVQSLFCAPLLRHALSNLLRNALKYSPPRSPVTVIVGMRHEKRWIHVLNRGPKLDPKLAHHLFEPGKKNPNGGMGFGLHITQACAQRMGGRVVFGSTETCTVFSLLLPLEVPPLEPIAPVGYDHPEPVGTHRD